MIFKFVNFKKWSQISQGEKHVQAFSGGFPTTKHKVDVLGFLAVSCSKMFWINQNGSNTQPLSDQLPSVVVASVGHAGHGRTCIVADEHTEKLSDASACLHCPCPHHISPSDAHFVATGFRRPRCLFNKDQRACRNHNPAHWTTHLTHG